MPTCCVCHQTNRPNAKFCSYCRAPLMLQGKYRITQLLGRGGFGAVYQAEQLHLGGAVCAVKELIPDPMATPQELQQATIQFQFEARVLAELSHPALPKVTDFFFEGNRYYLGMEFVPGETLEDLLARNNVPLPETQVIAWMQTLCDALTYLHTRPSPIIHRDVKPSNIKITPDGQLKLLDFGIAKMLSASTSTATAARAVSAPYSPLEQYGKGKGTSAASDIYATGVTMYRLLTNHLPPEAPDRVNEKVTPPRRLNTVLSAETESVVLKAMAEKQGDRFQNASELKRALTTPTLVYNQPPSVPQPVGYAPAIVNPNVQTQRNVLIRIAMALGLLLIIVVGGIIFGAQEIAKQQGIATAQAQATLVAVANATATAQAQATASAKAYATPTIQAQATATAKTYATTPAIPTVAPTRGNISISATPVPTTLPTTQMRAPQKRLVVSSGDPNAGNMDNLSVVDLTTNSKYLVYGEPGITSGVFSQDGTKVLVASNFKNGRVVRIVSTAGGPSSDVFVALCPPARNCGRWGSYELIWLLDNKNFLAREFTDSNGLVIRPLDPTDSKAVPKALPSSPLGQIPSDASYVPRFISTDGRYIVTISELSGNFAYAFEINGKDNWKVSERAPIQVYDQRFWPWKVMDAPAKCPSHEFFSECP